MTGTDRKFAHVSELVPHQAPMLALDELLEWKSGWAKVAATLGPQHLLARRGVADGSVALELMAQAVAACLGQEAFEQGVAVRNGMVIACRKLELARAEVTIGERHLIEVNCLRSTDYASYFDGQICDAAGELVASATFTLIHGEAPHD